MGPNRLALAVYRAMLRWSRANADVPFNLRPGDIAVLAPSLRGVRAAGSGSELTGGLLPHSALMRHADLGAAAIPALARAEIGACASAQGEEAAAALDRGLEAVRVLHTTYQQQLSAMREMRRDRGNKEGVKYAVGQVFVHKKFGFRGVIYGWDRECARDEAWMKAMNVQNPSQPFYYCLPDETDCVRLFGGVRITKYVAQDNIQPIRSTRIVHRALDSYFSGYSRSLSRYVPCPKLQWEYPDDYPYEDTAPIGDDANLLAHDEPEDEEAGQEARLQRGRNDARSWASSLA
jgi:hemimethylated DNA binding protein